MALIPTTLEVLGPKLVAQIEGTTPRIIRKGAEGWKNYERPADAPSRTRRFRLLWTPGPYTVGGIMHPVAVDCTALLTVRTDYAVPFEHVGELVDDDWHQLRERMHLLSGTGADGLILILETRTPPRPVIGGERDAMQFDLTYDVRYLKAR